MFSSFPIYYTGLKQCAGPDHHDNVIYIYA